MGFRSKNISEGMSRMISDLSMPQGKAILPQRHAGRGPSAYARGSNASSGRIPSSRGGGSVPSWLSEKVPWLDPDRHRQKSIRIHSRINSLPPDKQAEVLQDPQVQAQIARVRPLTPDLWSKDEVTGKYGIVSAGILSQEASIRKKQLETDNLWATAENNSLRLYESGI